MLDFKAGAELPPIRAYGANAMRADGNHLADPLGPQHFNIGLGSLCEGQVVAQPPGRIAGAFLFLEDSETDAKMTQHRDQREYDFAPLRVVSAHAAEPEAVFLRAVVNRQFVLFDELGAFAG